MASNDNELFQYSIMSALMDGVAANGLPLAKLLEHGDLGLGTFRHMVGEMVVVDGVIYQMKSDGSVNRVDVSGDASSPDANANAPVTPFAMVTRFRPTARDEHCPLPRKDAVFERLRELLLSAPNHFVALRADGAFRSVTVRTADGQRFPGEKVGALAGRQVTHVLERETGTLVGFWSPRYVQGVGVAGTHLHFVSADRRRGGHVLELEAGDGGVDLRAAAISKLHLQLPTDDPEFNAAALVLDDKGIQDVEGQ